MSKSYILPFTVVGLLLLLLSSVHTFAASNPCPAPHTHLSAGACVPDSSSSSGTGSGCWGTGGGSCSSNSGKSGDNQCWGTGGGSCTTTTQNPGVTYTQPPQYTYTGNSGSVSYQTQTTNTGSTNSTKPHKVYHKIGQGCDANSKGNTACEKGLRCEKPNPNLEKSPYTRNAAKGYTGICVSYHADGKECNIGKYEVCGVASYCVDKSAGISMPKPAELLGKNGVCTPWGVKGTPCGLIHKNNPNKDCKSGYTCSLHVKYKGVEYGYCEKK